MKKFIIHLCIFAVIVFISIFLILLQADGYADPYYLRFTAPKQTSLILGTSRAAQGIQPQIINTLLNRNDLYNFSFTIGTSPYGPTFLKSVKQKLDTNTQTGIFILAVDPWSISSSGEDPDNEDMFEERKLFLSTTKNINVHPNIPYLLKNFDDPYYKILFNKIPVSFIKQTRLHQDGWLEVLNDFNHKQIQHNTAQRVKEYRTQYLPRYSFSQTRLFYLTETIVYLKKYGEVFLVRLPVSEEIKLIDNQLISDFSEKMDRLATENQIPYIDLTDFGDRLSFTDGIHLSKGSGKEVSEMIAKWIITFEN